MKKSFPILIYSIKNTNSHATIGHKSSYKKVELMLHVKSLFAAIIYFVDLSIVPFRTSLLKYRLVLNESKRDWSHMMVSS